MATIQDTSQPLSSYPTTQYSFVDSMSLYALNTMPHMYAQTLEAISDWGTIGGRSIVGLMREQRNQARLTELGISLDNNISDNLDQSINDTITKSLIANGNLDGINTTLINGTTITNPDQTANLQVTVTDGDTTTVITTDPIGRYDPDTNTYVVDNPGYTPSVNPDIDTTGTTGGNISDPIDNPGGTYPPTLPPALPPTLDKGEPKVPGSGSGSPYVDPLPPTLDVSITSGQLTPSTYNVQQAIEEVIKCNCDCWE